MWEEYVINEATKQTRTRKLAKDELIKVHPMLADMLTPEVTYLCIHEHTSGGGHITHQFRDIVRSRRVIG